jgi:hypothetical protein
MTPRREFALVLLGSAILAVVVTWPLAVKFGRAGRVDNADGMFSIWNVSWVARTIVADPRNVFNANIFYPHRGTLAYSEANLGAGIVAAPVYWATKNPYAAHNVALFVSLIASAIGMFYLVRYLTGDRRAAVAPAIAYAFCPFVATHTAEIQLLMIGGLPFVMLAFHRLADAPGDRRGVMLGIVMAIQALFCGYYGVYAILMIAYATLVFAFSRRFWWNRRFWIALTVAAIVAIAIVFPAFVPYIRLQRAGFGRPLETAGSFSANWSTYFASASYAHSWMLKFLPPWAEVAFPGFFMTVSGAIGAWIARRQRRGELLWLYGGLAVFACWASFGPRAGLYSVLYRLVPLFSWLRSPARFGVVVIFAFCVLSGVALSAWLARARRSGTIAIVFAVLATAEVLVPWPVRDVEPPEAVYHTLAMLPSGPVIEMPFWYLEFMFPRQTYYMLQSTTHWMPLVNGYSDYTPPDYLDHVMTLATFPSPAAFKLLQQSDVRYAIIHRYWYSDENWSLVAPRLVQFRPYLRPIFADAGTQLYEIVGFPP